MEERDLIFSKLPGYVLMCQAAERAVLRLFERGSAFLSVRGDVKPGSYGMALEKPLQKAQVSLPVKGPDPKAAEHPSPWAVPSSRCAGAAPSRDFFQKQQPQPRRGGREGKQHCAWLGAGSADRLMRGVNFLRLSSLVFLRGKDDSHAGHGERCYMRGLWQRHEENRHRNACLGNWSWLHCTSALESGDQCGAHPQAVAEG